MPRCKIEVNFIGDITKRVRAFARRKKGIRKSAEELSVLCGVQVGVVCVYPDAVATDEKTAPVVWESEAGAFDRYLALPSEIRARHTHRSYLENELGKQKAKLARIEQNGPTKLTVTGQDLGLNEMTLDEARELLETIDAALQATAKRLEALGLPPDQSGYGSLEQIAPDAPGAVAPMDGHCDGVVPCTGNNLSDMDASFQLQMMPGQGNSDHYYGELEQFSWSQLHDAGMMQPENGFQCTGGNYMGAFDDNYMGAFDGNMGAFDGNYMYAVHNNEMQTLGYGNANYSYDSPHLTMWSTDESGNAVLPHEYYPSLGIGGTPAPELPAPGTIGSYMDAQPVGFNMGNAWNFATPDGYAAHLSLEELQHSGTGTSWPGASPQCSDPETHILSQASHRL